MAKTLTLEEAAQKLGLTPEQFKVNLKTHTDYRSVRPLMGGATMHFRAQDIDELARRIGLGSDPELPMGNAAAAVPLSTEDDEQIEIGRDQPRGSGQSSGRLSPSSSGKKPPAKPADVPLVTDSSEDFVPISGGPPKNAKPDSGAKLTKSGSDSDVKLEKRGPSKPVASSGTEEIIDLGDAPKQGSKLKRAGDVFELADEGSSKSSAKHKTAKKPVEDKEFELKLGGGPGSSSEFELTLADDSSDEADIGTMPRDVSGKKGGSGVKLNKPTDSGISLEKEKDSDSEFELNLDSSSSAKLAGPKSSGKLKKKPGQEPDSDSEFELTLDDSSSEIAPLDASGPQSDKDIFETDFDIPALDDESASEAVALEENDTDLESSDFDLAVEEGDDSASEVVEVDESGVEAVDAAEALAGVDEDEQGSRIVPAGAVQPAKWGPWSLVLAPALIVMFIVSLMSYELVHSMWGFHQPSNRPTSALTRGIASILGNDSDLPKEP